ncbi:selenide, water dikinase SelD [SAR116 cluster bacterium]|nr:selenide, water dikinase SelD [SAR116 cluster bacterium]
MNAALPTSGDLVLVGGGHAQVAALKSFAMRPLPGLRITLVSRDSHTPYSGMLPGYIEGIWSDADIHIDLTKLAAMAGARFIQDQALEIDANANLVHFAERPPIGFDMLAVNIGGEPDLDAIPGAREHAIPVKPISLFKGRLNALLEKSRPEKIIVIGGGAAGCELALALSKRWQREIGHRPKMALFARASRLVPEMPPRAAKLLGDDLAAIGCDVYCGQSVRQIGVSAVTLADGSMHDFDACFLVSAVAPPDWLASTGLTLDENGFIQVLPTLQSISHPHIFAAGDIASLTPEMRPKSGVYAVRAGPFLAHNLRQYAEGRRLRHWTPQRQALALIGCSDGTALALRGRYVSKSRAAWWLKKWIDRRWMAKYTALKMPPPSPPRPLAGLNSETIERRDPAFEAMRCLGCGAKTSHEILAAAMQQATANALKLGADPALMPPEGVDEDSAIIQPPRTGDLVQSVDVISEIVSDPFQLGRIAAVHALSDLYAANAAPHYAMAIVNLAPARADLQQDQLAALMTGGLLALSEAGVRLIGGHTSETDAMSIGFSVTGHRSKAPIPLTPVDDPVLLLTKAIGTGVIMAGHMQLRAPGNHVQTAIRSMAAGNGLAATALAHANPMMTDVTGFGLARHAMNLAQRSGFSGVQIDLQAVPLLLGAAALFKSGIRSSLHDQNENSVRLNAAAPTAVQDGVPMAALFDPQTSGGLLAVLPRKQAQKLSITLQKSGHNAAIIGILSLDWSGLRVS